MATKKKAPAPAAKTTESETVTVTATCSLAEGGRTYKSGECFQTTAARAEALGEAVKF